MNIDKVFAKSLDEVLKVLKKHGVESFKHGDLELKISPLKYVAPMQDEKYLAKSKEVTEEDLYYSASVIKPKAK